ncbi:MAG: hypothetical protein MJ240_08555 [Kiritimatiellae bacterium]|nr:hypothetical protein [Kiritimatiellia bacterium]
MKIKSFMIPIIALGTLFVVQAQEVDADALIGTLNAEISKIDEREAKETPKTESAAKDETSLLKPQPKPQRQKVARPVLDESGERATKDSKVVVVTAFGKGETKEEARKNAFRTAIEKAVGVYVDAESMMQNYEMVKDRVNTISNADITKCETLKEGRLKSGGYGVQIRATVEKKAITPKFKDVFPAAFADVEGVASSIHAQKVTAATRSTDAASLMKAAIGDVDRMRNWVRLSVVKGMELRPAKGNDNSGNEPGKGRYAVRYSMTVDNEAYFKGFVPHFKQVLSKMQIGEANEDVLLKAESLTLNERQSLTRSCNALFVNPVSLSGFPEVSIQGGRNPRGRGGNPSQFMFDQYKGLEKVQDGRSCNIWLLDRMNKDMTAVRCSAYKVPVAALHAYWKTVYGDLDSNYVCKKPANALGWRPVQKIEIVLLNKDGEEISATTDVVPTTLLTGGFVPRSRLEVRELWENANVFDSFFIRPLFGTSRKIGPVKGGYSSEIQRDAYLVLSDAQLAEVKRVEVRFVGGKKSRR